jgi:cysteinyl-tRNA synthetase
MTLQFQNSLTRKKEVFKPIDEGKARIYTCGPTVYNYAHIGNFRTFLFEDVLRRVLKYSGYEVTQVMNFTDVDDKTIRDSQAEGLPLDVFTERYKTAFLEDLDTLRIERAEHYPAATDYIDHMVKLIQTLVEKGHTYEDAGSVYFKLSTFPEYGRLANLDPDQMRSSGRVDSDEYEKDDARDFVLWKAWVPSDGDVFWETALGKGRPGWHIECSAMSMDLLGPHFDIHTGGVDNRFPHHENEIAQSRCATGSAFVNTWLHSEFLLVEGKKMSKSKGNFYTLRDLVEKGLDPLAIRYTLLSVHYGAQLNFSMDGIEASSQAIRRLRDFNRRLQSNTEANSGTTTDDSAALDRVKQCDAAFSAAISDDLNLAGALGHLFRFVRDGNAALDAGLVGLKGIAAFKAWMLKVDTILDVLSESACNDDTECEARELLEARTAAKASKDWGRADELRKQIQELGYDVKDTPQGAEIQKR